MTKTITGLFPERRSLDTAVRFLATEYGIPSAEFRAEPAAGEPNLGPRQLTVDVNDDEVDEIRAALTKMGAALKARA